MVYLLITWEEDNSLKIINCNTKAIILVDEEKIKFRWSRKRIYDGSIVDLSGKAQQVNEFCS